MTRHPRIAELALHAGGDLGWMARMRIDWHLRNCGACQQEITEFSSERAALANNAAEPSVNWKRLSAEMKANIRLGLAAGECIAPRPVPVRNNPRWAWAAMVTASMVVFAAGAEMWVRNSSISTRQIAALLTPGVSTAVLPTIAARQGVVLEIMDDGRNSGIQMRQGQAVMSELRNRNRGDRGDVVYSIDARGGVGASYVDRETGMVTVNNIYYGQ